MVRVSRLFLDVAILLIVISSDLLFSPTQMEENGEAIPKRKMGRQWELVTNFPTDPWPFPPVMVVRTRIVGVEVEVRNLDCISGAEVERSAFCILGAEVATSGELKQRFM